MKENVVSRLIARLLENMRARECVAGIHLVKTMKGVWGPTSTDRRWTCAHECRRFLSLLRPPGPENMAIKHRQEKHARLENP